MYGLQLIYIDNRNFPGGPLSYLTGPFTTNFDSVLTLAAYIIGNVMADCLLVSTAAQYQFAAWRMLSSGQLWRCQVIWYASLGKKSYLILFVPFLLWLASFGEFFSFSLEPSFSPKT